MVGAELLLQMWKRGLCNEGDGRDGVRIHKVRLCGNEQLPKGSLRTPPALLFVIDILLNLLSSYLLRHPALSFEQ